MRKAEKVKIVIFSKRLLKLTIHLSAMVDFEMDFLNTISDIKFTVCLLFTRVEAICAILKHSTSRKHFVRVCVSDP